MRVQVAVLSAGSSPARGPPTDSELASPDRLAARSPDRVLLGEGCAGSSAGAAQGEEALDASP
jgi:hypothetical protein